MNIIISVTNKFITFFFKKKSKSQNREKWQKCVGHGLVRSYASSHHWWCDRHCPVRDIYMSWTATVEEDGTISFNQEIWTVTWVQTSACPMIKPWQVHNNSSGGKKSISILQLASTRNDLFSLFIPCLSSQRGTQNGIRHSSLLYFDLTTTL